MKETKICSKCGVKKPFSEFYKAPKCANGVRPECKECRKQYREDNKEYIREQKSNYDRQYRQNNKKELKDRKKKYYQDNKEKIKKYRKENRKKIKQNWSKYYQENREQLLEQGKQYKQDNKERIAEYRKQYVSSPASYETYANQLFCEETWKDNSELVVRCAYCGKKFKPTVYAVSSRIKAINNVDEGELRFYCSDNCKQACPTYRRQKYPKGFKTGTSREVVPMLRQLVLERDNYSCQKCGATTETMQLHVHHIISYAQNKMQVNDPDSCITLCKDCHKEVHSQDGCRYTDLKCRDWDVKKYSKN